ncbi:MAG: HAMP domain-containing protein [Lachnospiraceae bacterium]|nr:HAMP domain-containing protein [Lachnospiraceae bacterium]
MKTRQLSMSTKILLIMLLLIVVSDVLLCNMAYLRAKDAMTSEIDASSVSIARCMAASLNGDLLAEIQVGDEGTEAYNTLLDQIALFRDNGGVEYAYTIKREGQTAVFLVDSDPDEPAAVGEGFDGDDTEITRAYAGESLATAEPYTDEWGTHLSAYSPVRNSAGQITGLAVVDVSMDDINANLKGLLINIVVMFCVIILVSVILLLLIRRMLNKGFRALNDEVEELTSGDEDLTLQLDVHSGDEFEVIAGNMNKFIEQIRQIVSGVKDNVESSISSSEELSSAAEQASGTMYDLSSAIDEVADGATRQAQDVNSASDNVDHIFASLSGMEETVQKAEDYTESMLDSSKGVSDSFEILIGSIQNSMQELAKVTEEMSNVGASVDTVTEAANAIDSIASQTNLLSLNASIEAARAGEAGRGFAVVAEEIGSLAEESNKSAGSIKQIMADLKRQTAEAIAMVSELNNVMKEQEKTSTVSRDSLQTLFDDIDNTQGTFELIRADVAKIESACSQLRSSIENLSDISEQNAATAQETAASIAQIMEVTKTVADRATDIKELSGGLGSMVSDYRA